MKVPGLSSIPTKPADYESLDGLRDKVAAAPRYGANGKYLILQAARLVAQKESSQAVEHSNQGAGSDVPATPAAAAAGATAQLQTSKRQRQPQQPSCQQQQQQQQTPAAAADLSAVQAAALLPNKLRPFVPVRPRAYTTQLQRQQAANKLLGPYLLLLLQELQTPPQHQQKLLMECMPLAKAAGAACLAQEEELYKAETNAQAYSARARQATALLKYVPEQQLRQLKEAVQTPPAAGAAAAAAATSTPAAPTVAAAGRAKAGSSVSVVAGTAHARQQEKEQDRLECSPPAKKQKLNQLLNSLFEDCEPAGHNQRVGSSSTPISNCTAAAAAAAAASHAMVSAQKSSQQSHHAHQQQQQQQQQPSGAEAVVLAGPPEIRGDSQDDQAAVRPQPAATTSTDQLHVDDLDEELERRELLDRKRQRQEALQHAVAAAAVAAAAGVAAGSSACARATCGAPTTWQAMTSYSPTASPERMDQPQSVPYSPSHEPAPAAAAATATTDVTDVRQLMMDHEGTVGGAAAPSVVVADVAHGAEAPGASGQPETGVELPAASPDVGVGRRLEDPDSLMKEHDPEEGAAAANSEAGSIAATAAATDADADADLAAASAAEEAAHAALEAAIFGDEEAPIGDEIAAALESAAGGRCSTDDSAGLDPAPEPEAAEAIATTAAAGEGDIQGQQQGKISSNPGWHTCAADEGDEGEQLAAEAGAALEGLRDQKDEAGMLQHDTQSSQGHDDWVDATDNYVCSEAANAPEADEVEMGCELHGDQQQRQLAGRRKSKQHGTTKRREKLAATAAPAAEGMENLSRNGAADEGGRGSVRVQVHTFITSVLEPLLKAGVVNYKLAEKVAGKATSKVMQKHAEADDATFLVREYGAITKLVTDLLDHYQQLR